MHVAITGGTGFIGSHVVERLAADGHELSCLVLPGERVDPLPGVAYREGDLRRPASLGDFLSGAETLVHLAGLTRASSEREFMDLNAECSAGLVREAIRVSPRLDHVIAMSSAAATGPAPDSRGNDEDAPQRPLTPYGRSKARMEELLRSFSGRISWTVLRAPGVYGPRDRDFLALFRMVARGVRLVVGRRNMVSLLYVRHLADAIAACVSNPAARNQAFCLSDDGSYDWDDIGAMMEAGLGRRTTRVYLPEWAVSAIALISCPLRFLSRKPPLITRDKVRELRQPYWNLRNDKAKRLLGWNPATPTARAFRETAEWYLDSGWIRGAS